MHYKVDKLNYSKSGPICTVSGFVAAGAVVWHRGSQLSQRCLFRKWLSSLQLLCPNMYVVHKIYVLKS